MLTVQKANSDVVLSVSLIRMPTAEIAGDQAVFVFARAVQHRLAFSGEGNRAPTEISLTSVPTHAQINGVSLSCSLRSRPNQRRQLRRPLRPPLVIQSKDLAGLGR